MAGKVSWQIWLLIVGLPVTIALLVGLGYFSLTHPTYSIPSNSGVPNVLQGDIIIARGSKFTCGVIQPQRGDIVLFRHQTTTYFKRLLGLPGERIQFRNGVPVINGRPVSQTIEGQTTINLSEMPAKADLVRETWPNGRSYLIAVVDRRQDQENTAEITLPAGQYYMVGDSRDNSLDSRFDEAVGGIGLVPTGNLCAVATRVLYSPDRTHVWKPL